MRINKQQSDRKPHRPGGLTLTRAALTHCTLAPKDPVLDAGCGYGATCTFLANETGLRIYGMDASEERISTAVAEQNGQNNWAGIRGRIPRLPFASATFKGIFCECVLSLVPEKKDCLNEFFRLLQPGGQLVLTDLYLPGECSAALEGQAPLTCLDGALSKAALIQAIEQAGFNIRIWEDHTRLLKQLACEMVFKHGSLDNFWKTLTGDVLNAGLTSGCRTGDIKPGYCLIVADKTAKKTVEQNE